MKLRIYRFDNSTYIINCKSFEFRSNKIGNWIKCIGFDDYETILYDVSKIETVEESIKK